MDTFKLTPALLQAIKIAIDQYSRQEKKPQGYTELIGCYGKGFVTKGQASKIKSFYVNFSSNDIEDQDKKRLYDSINILPFCTNSLNHLKNTEKTSQKIKSLASVTPTRTVDRLTKPSLASVSPPELDTNPMAVNESLKLSQEKLRIIEIINRSGRF